eukprot:355847-Chlamydomonas_euryale.AAC.6
MPSDTPSAAPCTAALAGASSRHAAARGTASTIVWLHVATARRQPAAAAEAAGEGTSFVYERRQLVVALDCQLHQHLRELWGAGCEVSCGRARASAIHWCAQSPAPPAPA